MTENDVDASDTAPGTTHESAANEPAATGAAPQYGVGPFTIREVAILGAWVIAFVVSFFSVWDRGFQSVWTSGIDWILTIGVPTVAVFLIVLRRFSPDGIRRVGSLGVDQFASVAFSVSAVIWLEYIWSTVATVAPGGPWLTTWVVWVEFFAMLALVFFSVFAPFIAPFDEDFRARPEAPAHRNARAVRPVVARPRPEPAPVEDRDDSAPAADDDETGVVDPIDPYAPAPAAATDEQTWAPAYARSGYAPAEGPVDADPAASAPAPEPETVSHQPFWALVPVERDVVDEQTGQPLFRIGPTAWALVVADRGSSFVVRHDDGRVGVLYDVSGVTRG
ncbi:hypothetical protein M4I32_10275 [Microbacterium sp. LRZ72]|uniref:hypothetical protein n=1 Tax=Microbacterium sp. LRZ72 TaxID=2942481 RepID=UPI0029A014CC|nr:hypothetical protein [Microbacterium sp. LRZ72]MDX2377184.1 hypothetical protein [Microbacterium sp. LRZ72]